MRRGIAASVALVSVGMFTLAACGGGTGTNASSQSSTTTTSSSGNGQGQSGSEGSNGAGGSSSSGSSNGSNGSSPKPTFTSAAVSPGLVTCAKLGDPKDVTVSWTTKNATQVTVKAPGATGEYFPAAASGSGP